MDIPLTRLREHETLTDIKKTSYIRSYPHLISFVGSLRPINETIFTAAAHMVYGWMPTTLEFGDDEGGDDSLARGSELLSRSILPTASINEDELATLKELINNSIVGTSKLLHFLNPYVFPIWDRRVYRWIHGRFSYHHLEQPAKYLEYAAELRRVTSEPEYEEIHKSIATKLGYKVSPLRSAELIMFLRGNG